MSSKRAKTKAPTTKVPTTKANQSKPPSKPKEACPELFTKPPPQPKGKKKPGQLTSQQLRQYYQEGFIVLTSFFKDSEFDPVLEAIDKEVDLIAERLYKAGKIKNKYEDADVFHRFSLINKEFPGAPILIHKTGRLPEAFKKLWANDRLLNMMEQLVGPEVAGNPVWNIRPKTPMTEEATVPWHQDNGYYDETAQELFIPTAWIPMLDVEENNGCLQVLRGGHRTGVLAKHTCCAGGTFYIQTSEEEMVKSLGVDMKKDLVTCEMKKGDFILFNNLTPHRSFENYSDNIRWAFDFRYQTAEKSAGFHGIKDPVLLRSKKNPKHEIKWDEFTKVNRTVVTNLAKVGSPAKEEEFDTTLSGPWMDRWELVNHNRHTVNWEK
ncbi:uncharacterized protein [Amphiura filiformis]|uniref:uncharacterized protein isoform X1 n=1 Tax=Amphiura filiformis TaxID=82378 RepID=UPI003B21D678